MGSRLWVDQRRSYYSTVVNWSVDLGRHISMTLETNLADFNAALSRYMAAFKLRRREAIRFAAGRLVDRLMRFTPPPRESKGTKAVRRDIRRAMRPLIPSHFKDKRIKQMIREKNVRVLQAIFRSMGSTMADVKVEKFDPSLHRKVQDSRGRVLRWSRVVTPDVQELRDYTELIKQRVGWAKGGWVAAATALGRDVLPWVQRHRAAGSYSDTLNEPVDDPAIEITSFAKWAGKEESRIKANALRETQREMLQSVSRAESLAQRDALSYGSRLAQVMFA